MRHNFDRKRVASRRPITNHGSSNPRRSAVYNTQTGLMAALIAINMFAFAGCGDEEPSEVKAGDTYVTANLIVPLINEFDKDRDKSLAREHTPGRGESMQHVVCRKLQSERPELGIELDKCVEDVETDPTIGTLNQYLVIGVDCDDFDALVFPGAAERCNGKDDGCNNQTDEGFELNVACDGADADQCPEGTTVCNAAGNGTECNDATGDSVELCDGADNDCNGQTDEGLLDTDGDTQADCVDPDDDNDNDPDATDCAPTNLAINHAAVEVCDTVDNDCDGNVDNGFVLGNACDGADADQCPEGTTVCNAAGDGVICNDDPAEDDVELCGNALDDDCNGQTDEGFDMVGSPCDGADNDNCPEGVFVCTADGSGTECNDDANENDVEVCDGADNDCNPATNDGSAEPNNGTACYPEGTAGCVPDGAGGFNCNGVCNPGTFACSEGQMVCAGWQIPRPDGELCGNALDDDCNGVVDDPARDCCDEDADCEGFVPAGYNPDPAPGATWWRNAHLIFGCQEDPERPRFHQCVEVEDTDNDGLPAAEERQCIDRIDGDLDGNVDECALGFACDQQTGWCVFVQPPDPCAGVVCNTPPVNVCQDANNLTRYSAEGQCANGQCSYGSENVACQFGCANGTCNPDPCAGVVCNTPPVNVCQDANNLTRYSAEGQCANGQCSYGSENTPCRLGCDAGACNLDAKGRTGYGESGANGGPWPDGTVDNVDDDGDCYCEGPAACQRSINAACAAPLGTGDCDDDPTDGVAVQFDGYRTDGSWFNHPGAAEWCEQVPGFDNDCDGVPNDGCP